MHGMTIDRRVKKTKKQLRLALMHLMTQKSAKSISVRELAEQADINRSTFYIHYKDVNDLLLHLEDEMAERLSELCRRHDPRDSMTGGYPFLTDLYAFIQENADLCKVLLGGYGDRAYTERICRILRDDFIERVSVPAMSRRPGEDPLLLRLHRAGKSDAGPALASGRHQRIPGGNSPLRRAVHQQRCAVLCRKIIEMKRASRNNKKWLLTACQEPFLYVSSLPLYRTNRCPSSTAVTPNSRLSAVYSIATPVFPLCSRPAVSTEKVEKVVKPPHTPTRRNKSSCGFSLAYFPASAPIRPSAKAPAILMHRVIAGKPLTGFRGSSPSR